jgi:hypothetical protein
VDSIRACGVPYHFTGDEPLQNKQPSNGDHINSDDYIVYEQSYNEQPNSDYGTNDYIDGGELSNDDQFNAPNSHSDQYDHNTSDEQVHNEQDQGIDDHNGNNQPSMDNGTNDHLNDGELSNGDEQLHRQHFSGDELLHNEQLSNGDHTNSDDYSDQYDHITSDEQVHNEQDLGINDHNGNTRPSSDHGTNDHINGGELSNGDEQFNGLNLPSDQFHNKQLASTEDHNGGDHTATDHGGDHINSINDHIDGGELSNGDEEIAHGIYDHIHDHATNSPAVTTAHGDHINSINDHINCGELSCDRNIGLPWPLQLWHLLFVVPVWAGRILDNQLNTNKYFAGDEHLYNEQLNDYTSDEQFYNKQPSSHHGIKGHTNGGELSNGIGDHNGGDCSNGSPWPQQYNEQPNSDYGANDNIIGGDHSNVDQHFNAPNHSDQYDHITSDEQVHNEQDQGIDDRNGNKEPSSDHGTNDHINGGELSNCDEQFNGVNLHSDQFYNKQLASTDDHNGDDHTVTDHADHINSSINDHIDRGELSNGDGHVTSEHYDHITSDEQVHNEQDQGIYAHNGNK